MLTVLFSLRETSRPPVEQEASHDGNWSASLVSRSARPGWDLLDVPLTIVGAPGVPVPYAGPLEYAWLSSADGFVAGARNLVAY